MWMCASGFSDLCIWCRDHILLPAICASGIIIFLFFFFLVTFLLWKEDLAEKIFLTIGREHLSRFFSWLIFTFQWVGMVVPLASRNYKWFVRFRFEKRKRKKRTDKNVLSFWSQGARRDISWVCSAQFNDGWRRLIERNERDWKWSFRICSISDLICRRKTNNPYSICVKFIIGNKKTMNRFS